MEYLKTLAKWAHTPERQRSAADYCHRLALEHCATGELTFALAWSRTAKALERLTKERQDAREEVPYNPPQM